jgi:hypothetical protein
MFFLAGVFALAGAHPQQEHQDSLSPSSSNGSSETTAAVDRLALLAQSAMQKQLAAQQQQQQQGDSDASVSGLNLEQTPWIGAGGIGRRLLQGGYTQLRPTANTSRCLGPPGGSYSNGGQLLLADCTGELLTGAAAAAATGVPCLSQQLQQPPQLQPWAWVFRTQGPQQQQQQSLQLKMAHPACQRSCTCSKCIKKPVCVTGEAAIAAAAGGRSADPC